MLKKIADTLWCVEDKLKMTGVHFDIRMVVVKLSSGGLLLHSPIEIDDGLAAQLATIGPVAHIVAPSLYHHLWVGATAQRYPSAKVWGCPGMAQKSKVSKLCEVGDEQLSTWLPDLQAIAVAGNPRAGELVFLHVESKTLILCDLVFHMKELTGPLTPVVFWMAGTKGRFAQSRLWRSSIKDRAATRQSVQSMLHWDFDRVVMSHGEIVHDGGKERMRLAMTPLLGSP